MKLWEKIRDILPMTRAQHQRNLIDANAFLVTEWKKTLGVQGSKTDRSKPGQAPKRQTGGLQESIYGEVKEGASIIRSRSPLAAIMEAGTRRMLPRPHRELTLARVRPEMMKILARKRS